MKTVLTLEPLQKENLANSTIFSDLREQLEADKELYDKCLEIQKIREAKNEQKKELLCSMGILDDY